MGFTVLDYKEANIVCGIKVAVGVISDFSSTLHLFDHYLDAKYVFTERSSGEEYMKHHTRTLCMYVCMYVCVYVCTYVCMFLCMYVCVCVYMYVCVYVCMYVSMYVCMYECVLVFFMCLYDYSILQGSDGRVEGLDAGTVCVVSLLCGRRMVQLDTSVYCGLCVDDWLR